MPRIDAVGIIFNRIPYCFYRRDIKEQLESLMDNKQREIFQMSLSVVSLGELKTLYQQKAEECKIEDLLSQYDFSAFEI